MNNKNDNNKTVIYHSLVWFSSFVYWHINLHESINAKAIIVEEQ